MPERKVLEEIHIFAITDEGTLQDELGIYANGFWYDNHYYGIVTIGDQIWLAENLNTGIRISSLNDPSDNDIIEKYCYDDDERNCDTYGGLYTWDEMMDYHPSDSGAIGITQGICPDGWHIPTYLESPMHPDFMEVVEAHRGGMFKDTGTIEAGTGLWLSPNEGATNETGFSGLPGGYFDSKNVLFDQIDGSANYHTSTLRPDIYEFICTYGWCLVYIANSLAPRSFPTFVAFSVRCIKDPD
jgi:uncharacterized protein (TIGR02145 family)